MSLLSELLKESATAGSTSSGGIANSRGTLFGNDTSNNTTMLRRMGFVEVDELPNKKNKKLFKSLREDSTPNTTVVKPYDYQDTLSKLDQAVKSAGEKKENIAVFGLEDDEGKVIKVYIDKDDANRFEETLAVMLADNDTIFNDEDEPKTEQEIAEILYKLKDSFNIRDVEWGTIHGDEEEEEADVQSDEDAEGEGEDAEGEDAEGDSEPAEDETAATSALQSVIDMMKADSAARQADAEARKAEADAIIAKNASAAAQAKVAQEEDLLDMKAHEKAQRDAKREAETLAKLAKYKKEVAADKPEPEIDGDDGSEDFDADDETNLDDDISDDDDLDIDLNPEENEEMSDEGEKEEKEITKEELANLLLQFAQQN